MANNGLTFQLPMIASNSDPGGFVLIKTYKDLAKQHLKMVILTNPGERVMDPNFGVGVKQYLFEPSAILIEEDIKGKILQQVSLYISYISIGDIQVQKDEDNSTAYLSLYYKILPLDMVDELNISWPLD